MESLDERDTSIFPSTEQNADKITSDPPEVDSRQASITIGTIGEVGHGKTTLIKALSGVQTGRFWCERWKNMTIKLGYANTKIYKCDDEDCPRPGCYKSFPSSQETTVSCDRPGCAGQLQLIRHVSFLDCPGADILLATMLNGLVAMDAAILLIAANLPCPQPQASEHLAAAELMNINDVIVLQSKTDFVKDPDIKEHYSQIQEFIKGNMAEGAPVIPISAIKNQNMDLVCEYMASIPVPVRDYTSDPRMFVIRSFDVNKPGRKDAQLQGGIAGGSLLKGALQVGKEIEFRPGTVSKGAEGNFTCTPMKTRVMSLFSEQTELQYAVPGGLIGVGTTLDAVLFRADKMVGQVLGAVGSLPDVYTQLTVSFLLLRRLLGVHSQDGQRGPKVQKLSKHEVLMVTIGSLSTGCCVLASKGDLAKLSLARPVCAEIGQTVALSRRMDRHWRLVGKGYIKDGVKAKIVDHNK